MGEKASIEKVLRQKFQEEIDEPIKFIPSTAEQTLIELRRQGVRKVKHFYIIIAFTSVSILFSAYGLFFNEKTHSISESKSQKTESKLQESKHLLYEYDKKVKIEEKRKLKTSKKDSV